MERNMRMMVLDEVESGSQLARSPKGGRPTREAASQLGAHILDVAIEHFLRHGFEGANMDAIAADAQVSKRTLYQRHESKKGLLLAVLERERHIYLAIVDTPLPEGSARQRIALLAQTILDDILTPKIRGFVKLREEVERVEPGFDDDSRDIVMGHWISAFRSILAGDPGLSGLDPDRLQFMASLSVVRTFGASRGVN
ncbi:MAG: hypothetical protein DI568_12695 [Sphingomonas sp.]|nr:MAG: hypothetical protein DI568_12695 [Sphingomonas sp.]